MADAGLKDCSPQMQAETDKEVSVILDGCYHKAKQTVSENLPEIKRLAEYLFENESITGEKFMELIRKITAVICVRIVQDKKFNCLSLKNNVVLYSICFFIPVIIMAGCLICPEFIHSEIKVSCGWI